MSLGLSLGGVLSMAQDELRDLFDHDEAGREEQADEPLAAGERGGAEDPLQNAQLGGQDDASSVPP